MITQETSGQKITTYYAEAQKRKEGIAHHNEQAEKMRKLRSQQESPLSKVKRVAEKVKEKVSPTAKKVGGFVKERSAAIAHESRDIRPRRQSYGGSVPGSAIPGMGNDPFGIGSMPNPFAPPRSAPAAPRRRKRKKTYSSPAPRRRAPARSGGGGGLNMGIPKHMRWMF
jgi:hypothetical protein